MKPAPRTPVWTTPADIAAKVRRRWDDGSVLRAIAAGAAFEPITVPLRGPRATEIGDDIASVQRWIERLTEYDGPRYTLTWAPIGGRAVGRNRVPTHAVVESISQLTALLGIDAELRRFEAVLRVVGEPGDVRAWVAAQPHRAIALATEMPRLLAAYRWLAAHRNSRLYLRQITAPGVDTKFAERHRGVLAAMLGVAGSASGFLDDLGLARRPDLLRLRLAPELRFAPPLAEMALRTTELASVDIRPASVVVLENEITYLSIPVPPGGVVIWGRGFAVDALGALPWMRDVPIDYWGDLDTHGFVILDRFRAHLPQVRSVLMDAATLHEHRDRWVTEDSPAVRELPRLTAMERDVYAGLVTDTWGERVRLEQERIDWAWALRQLAR